ncbi:MAG: Rv0340 family protein [Mycobacterium sp.]|nr:Rv0340 family protein [Mycobacterium sp.]
MANPLLDFVMSVVRDPDVAAHYAADPNGAIADANLSGVTTADVAHLIPVVTESLGSMSSAAGGVPSAGLGDPGVNVWSSGAATAAFDAFDTVGTHVTQLPDIGIHQVISDPAAVGVDGGSGLADHPGWPELATVDDPGLHADVPVVDTGHLIDPAVPGLDTADWHHPTDPAAGTEHHQGFDFFS